MMDLNKKRIPLRASLTALRRIKPHVPKIRDRIVEQLAEAPLTAEEIAEVSGIRAGSVSPTISKLRQDGVVRPTGHMRPTSSGNPATVWELGAEVTPPPRSTSSRLQDALSEIKRLKTENQLLQTQLADADGYTFECECGQVYEIGLADE